MKDLLGTTYADPGKSVHTIILGIVNHIQTHD